VDVNVLVSVPVCFVSHSETSRFTFLLGSYGIIKKTVEFLLLKAGMRLYFCF
jgi:hypothetical protein